MTAVGFSDMPVGTIVNMAYACDECEELDPNESSPAALTDHAVDGEI